MIIIEYKFEKLIELKGCGSVWDWFNWSSFVFFFFCLQIEFSHEWNEFFKERNKQKLNSYFNKCVWEFVCQPLKLTCLSPSVSASVIMRLISSSVNCWPSFFMTFLSSSAVMKWSPFSSNILNVFSKSVLLSYLSGDIFIDIHMANSLKSTVPLPLKKKIRIYSVLSPNFRNTIFRFNTILFDLKYPKIVYSHSLSLEFESGVENCRKIRFKRDKSRF